MVKYRSRLHNSLLFFVNSYGFMLSLLILLWLATGERLFFVNVFINMTPVTFYGMPFALFLAILLKGRRSVFFLLIPTVICLLWYAPRFFPRSIENADGQELVLLSYNLYAGNHNYEALGEILREADADIVALQEVNWQTGDWLEANWLDEYPYFVRYTPEIEPQYVGRFLLSRYPIQASENLFITKLQIRAEVDVLGRTVVVYDVHMPPPDYQPFDTTMRQRNMNNLLDTAQEDRPVILMGDFNMSDQSQDYRHISSLYRDTFLETSMGLGTSFPNARRFVDWLPFLPPMIRIDYIFLSEEFAPQQSRVLYEGSSDHYPLWARVILK